MSLSGSGWVIDSELTKKGGVACMPEIGGIMCSGRVGGLVDHGGAFHRLHGLLGAAVPRCGVVGAPWQSGDVAREYEGNEAERGVLVHGGCEDSLLDRGVQHCPDDAGTDLQLLCVAAGRGDERDPGRGEGEEVPLFVAPNKN